MNRKMLAAAAIAVAFTGFAAPLAHAETTSNGVITVPDDFVPSLSDTRATGHYEVVGTGLRVFTLGATSTDKVAEYVATSTPLAQAGEPALNFSNTSGGGTPGAQLVTDFDNNGTADGILVGEPGAYGNDWWLSNSASQFVKDGAPSHTTGSGSANHGTLDQWRTAFPNATVLAFGFSLGSGVKGDGVINSIDFAATRYTFRNAVVLQDRAECKNDGWKTSTSPVFKNQGECVSRFAAGK